MGARQIVSEVDTKVRNAAVTSFASIRRVSRRGTMRNMEKPVTTVRRFERRTGHGVATTPTNSPAADTLSRSPHRDSNPIGVDR